MTEPFVTRLIDEEEKLFRKLADLTKFTATATFAALTHEEQRLLRAQREAMLTYCRVLKARIQYYGGAGGQ
jgi:hypothetical protein